MVDQVKTGSSLGFIQTERDLHVQGISLALVVVRDDAIQGRLCSACPARSLRSRFCYSTKSRSSLVSVLCLSHKWFRNQHNITTGEYRVTALGKARPAFTLRRKCITRTSRTS